jgi:predicted protein tyrosine phosphatase
MKISERTIKRLGEIITGDKPVSQCRSGPQLLDHLGAHSQSAPSINPKARLFLLVWFGNIMRSPTTEALFRKVAAEAHLPIQARSAGLHAIAGTPPDPRALRVAQEMKAPSNGHRAQLLTQALVAGADVVFAMD